MAKISAKQKKLKKEKLVVLHAVKRAELKKIIVDQSSSSEARIAARDTLNKMPTNGSKVRHKNRCSITGRPKGYIRDFGVSRITFRELASRALIPGVTKASW